MEINTELDSAALRKRSFSKKLFKLEKVENASFKF